VTPSIAAAGVVPAGGRVREEPGAELLRGIADGVNAELEVGRFLTEHASFVHAAPLAGALEYRAPRSVPATIAILQGYVPNEGDAFRFTVDQVQQFFQRALARTAGGGDVPPESGGPVELMVQEPPPLVGEMMGGYPRVRAHAGRRTAELHLCAVARHRGRCLRAGRVPML